MVFGASYCAIYGYSLTSGWPLGCTHWPSLRDENNAGLPTPTRSTGRTCVLSHTLRDIYIIDISHFSTVVLVPFGCEFGLLFGTIYCARRRILHNEKYDILFWLQNLQLFVILFSCRHIFCTQFCILSRYKVIL